jgi:hypothetical protein
MTDCEHCHMEIRKDDDFILNGKYPGRWQKWEANTFPSGWPLRSVSSEGFGTAHPKACFLDMVRSEGAKH